MKIDLLTIYIDDEDFYGIDILSIRSKNLISITYDRFFKKWHLELLFKPLF
jgi:hypothetical protein